MVCCLKTEHSYKRELWRRCDLKRARRRFWNDFRAQTAWISLITYTESRSRLFMISGSFNIIWKSKISFEKTRWERRAKNCQACSIPPHKSSRDAEDEWKADKLLAILHDQWAHQNTSGLLQWTKIHDNVSLLTKARQDLQVLVGFLSKCKRLFKAPLSTFLLGYCLKKPLFVMKEHRYWLKLFDTLVLSSKADFCK